MWIHFIEYWHTSWMKEQRTETRKTIDNYMNLDSTNTSQISHIAIIFFYWQSFTHFSSVDFMWMFQWCLFMSNFVCGTIFVKPHFDIEKSIMSAQSSSRTKRTVISALKASQTARDRKKTNKTEIQICLVGIWAWALNTYTHLLCDFLFIR